MSEPDSTAPEGEAPHEDRDDLENHDDDQDPSLEESNIEDLELPPPADGERGDEAALGEDDTATFDATELTMPPLPPTSRFGGPADASDEQPLLVADELGPPSELQQAYECLEIRTPVQEYESYVRARLEALIRLGRSREAEATTAALELGLDALRRAMGQRGKADA